MTASLDQVRAWERRRERGCGGEAAAEEGGVEGELSRRSMPSSRGKGDGGGD